MARRARGLGRRPGGPDWCGLGRPVITERAARRQWADPAEFGPGLRWSEAQLAGDDVPLDVVGAGVDQAPHAVAEVSLDPGLCDVARCPEDLHRVEAVLDEAFRD